MAARLKFNRLVLIAPGRTYDVPFFDGVNIITGPIYTGKSSILQLLDYVFGAKHPPSYPQIQKCSDVLVECSAGDEVLTIRRPLKGETAKAFLFDGPISEAITGAREAQEVSASHIPDGASVSSEVLKRLRLANIDVKTAPTRDSSDTTSYSARDLLLLLYVDQDRMGSKKGFFEDNQFKRNKWRAGFQIVHGLFDYAATALSEALKTAEQDRNRVKDFLDHARRFLTQSKVPEAEVLEARIAELKVDQQRAKAAISSVRTTIRVQMGENFSLVTRREDLSEKIDRASARLEELQRTLAQLGRLRVQYGRELQQIEFLSESETLVGRLPVIRCPGCLQPIETQPDLQSCNVCHRDVPRRDGEISVEARLRATRRKITDLESYIQEIESDASTLEQQKASLENQIAEVDESLANLRQIALLPDTREVLEASAALSLINKSIEQAERELFLRHRAQGEGSNLLALEERVRMIREELDSLNRSRPSPEQIIRSLSDLFTETLRQIKFPEVKDSWIDINDFIPYVRAQPYQALSSKGAISLAMMSWHFAVLRFALTAESKFPRILLLDSPLNHVGHRSEDEQFKDQQIVEAFYRYLARLHDAFSADFQIIVIDNAPPDQAAPLIRVSFTGDPNRGRFGLIDDEHPAKDQEQTGVAE